MLRGDIPEVLFSSIRRDDPYRASKVFQVERWCYAHWELHARNGQKVHNFLAYALSSEDCWKKVGGLHGVKLDRQMVGKKLIAPGLDNLFSTYDKYDIACRCSLEKDIITLFGIFKQKHNIESGDTDRLKKLVNNLDKNPLMIFWSHFISGYISKLNLNGRHPYEYGLECAMDFKQVEAVEFFWNKIKSLPENELSAQQKGEIFMKYAVYAAGRHCGSYPEIFEFCFSQTNPDRYSELLKRDFAENGYYSTLYTLKKGYSFDNLKTLFDCLQPNSILENHYYTLLRSTLLKSVEVENYSKHYADAGIGLFTYMWMKERFNTHRFFTLYKEMTRLSSRGEILIPLVNNGYMEPVWAVLDKANSDQIKEFMSSREADYISSVLKERRDKDSLDKFLSYGKPVVEECEADLTEVKLSKVYNLRARNEVRYKI